jgi:shikimate dehydrogenase
MSTRSRAAPQPIQPVAAPTFTFIGVTTGGSSIIELFPLWVAALGRPEVIIEGIDLEPHSAPQHYRRVVAQIKGDALSLGALITTHKIDLLDAARDMFDALDPYARICDEVSYIAKEGDALVGYAKDPVCAGMSLDALLGEGYFREGSDVLCLGAGGAATAIALHLVRKPDPADRPRWFIVVNRSPGRLERLRRMIEQLGTDIAFEYVCNQDPQRNDQIVARLPPGSVVINATGMGKDRPGSPLTRAALFPLDGIAWELNYRGTLDFMRQALAQRDSRNLTVEDGWRYFLHGWTEAIAQALGTELDPSTFRRLAHIAEPMRPQRSR